MDVLSKIKLPRFIQPVLFLTDMEIKRFNHIAEVKEFVSGLFTEIYRREMAEEIITNMEIYEFNNFSEMFDRDGFNIIAPYITRLAEEYYQDMEECKADEDKELYFDIKRDYLKIQYLLNLNDYPTTQQCVNTFLGAAKKTREGDTSEYSAIVKILKSS